MSKILKFFAPILVIIVGIGAVSVLNATKPEPEKTNTEPRPVALFVDEVAYTDLSINIAAQGEVRPKVEISIIPQVGGRIVSVSPSFRNGATVKAGETLIKIDDSNYRIAVVQAEARVAAAELQLALREGEAEVAAKQWDESVGGSPTALALKQPHVQEAKANLLSARAELELARLNLERTNVTVPFDGLIKEKSADLGQFVSPGVALGRAYSTEVVEVRLPLSDSQIAKLGLPLAYSANGHDGPKVNFSAVVAGEMRHWEGHIVRTDASIDSETRMIYVVAELDAPYGAGRDGDMPMAVGLFVDANIEGQRVERVLGFSREALRGSNRVYLVDEDDRLRFREVEVIYTDRDQVLVQSGVKEGDRVVISSIRSPREGMRIQALERNASEAFAASSANAN